MLLLAERFLLHCLWKLSRDISGRVGQLAHLHVIEKSLGPTFLIKRKNWARNTGGSLCDTVKHQCRPFSGGKNSTFFLLLPKHILGWRAVHRRKCPYFYFQFFPLHLVFFSYEVDVNSENFCDKKSNLSPPEKFFFLQRKLCRKIVEKITAFTWWTERDG